MMLRSFARAAINGVAVALPEQTLSNETMTADADDRTRALLLRHTGVVCRHVAAEGETALDLGEVACRKLFVAHPDLAERVDTLIFCTQSPDYILPPNSCVLHGRLGLRDGREGPAGERRRLDGVRGDQGGTSEQGQEAHRRPGPQRPPA